MASMVERVAARYALFQEVQPFIWRGNYATFYVDGVPFEVEFKGKSINHHKFGPISGYQVSFYKAAFKDAPWAFKPTGEGKALPILGTVVAIVKDFLAKRSPLYVWFVADEDTRARLYNRLIKRMVTPAYAAEITGHGLYTLRRTKSVFE